MASFIVFKMITMMYKFDADTIDGIEAFFAVFTTIESILVNVLVVANIREIADYVKGLFKQ